MTPKTVIIHATNGHVFLAWPLEGFVLMTSKKKMMLHVASKPRELYDLAIVRFTQK